MTGYTTSHFTLGHGQEKSELSFIATIMIYFSVGGLGACLRDFEVIAACVVKYKNVSFLGSKKFGVADALATPHLLK